MTADGGRERTGAGMRWLRKEMKGGRERKRVKRRRRGCEGRRKRQKRGAVRGSVKHRRRGLKGKCKEYITNLSPLAVPSPFTHSAVTKKAKRVGGPSLGSQQSITHTGRESEKRGALQISGLGDGDALRNEGSRRRNEIELIGAVKCSNTHTQTSLRNMINVVNSREHQSGQDLSPSSRHTHKWWSSTL